MRIQIRRRFWRPIDKIIAAAVSLALLAGLTVFVLGVLLPEKCGDGLEPTGPAEECVGVTTEAFVFDENIEDLVKAVAAENERVRQAWEEPQNGKSPVPYVRIALMMPYTSDASSAMPPRLIKHALAGAYIAQRRANQGPGIQYQLLMANDGKDLDQWEPVVEELATMTGGDSPLVAVIGFPNSTPATQRAAEALSAERIPAIGPVITSPDMSAKYLFKTSASNEQFARALERHLSREPWSGVGFLVSDARRRDNYALNLKRVFMERFGEEFGLRGRHASYQGETGDAKVVRQRFEPIVQEICLTPADTVFYAGRDRDLPVLITELANNPSCDHDKPMRIIKVGIGRDPSFTTPKITQLMREARISTVGAVDVHPGWWQGTQAEPPGFAGFHEGFQRLRQRTDLGKEPLADGYMIMYHDALTAAAQAAGAAYNARNPQGEGSGGEQDGRKNTAERDGPRMPTTEDVYRTMLNMDLVDVRDGTRCVDCVRGASGTFGFGDNPSTDHWPVCKPVPVIQYPPSAKESEGSEKSEESEGSGKPEVFRTHEDIFGGC